jgi:membrane-associated protein
VAAGERDPENRVGFFRGGPGYLDRHGGRRSQAAIAKTESFYRKFGWWSVVIARFMPWARSSFR